MNRLISVAIVGVLLSSAGLHAQEKYEYSSPEALVSGLKTASRDEQISIAKRLGISAFNPKTGFRNCDLQTDAAKLDPERATSVLRIKCGYDLNVVVLGQKSGGGQWERLDTIYIYSAYDRTTVTYASLINPRVQEMILHDAATVSGNLYQTQFLVLRLVDGRLRIALAILETASEPHVGGEPRALTSAITIQPATATEAGEVIQKAKIRVGERHYTIRKSFSWNPDLDIFAQDEVEDIAVKE